MKEGLQEPMFRVVFLFLVTWSLLSPIWSQAAAATQSVSVYRTDGSRQCEEGSGVAPEEMALELTRTGVKILEQRVGYDGREGIALCGQPTGSINIYRIAGADLERALALGFVRCVRAECP